MDCDLSFKSHINQVTKICFYHLRNIARIRPFLSFNDAKKLINVFIFSRLDYCNAVYTGLPKGSMVKLQLIQNAAARVLMKLKKREYITPVLKELHWLPVHQRIDYKILTLVCKALHNLTPSYISD